jgi:hypothetical protein
VILSGRTDAILLSRYALCVIGRGDGARRLLEAGPAMNGHAAQPGTELTDPTRGRTQATLETS